MKKYHSCRQLRGWILTPLLGVVLITGCAQENQMTRLTLGQSFVALNGISGWIAKEQGFFENYGLDVTLTLIRGDTQGVQALLGGEALIS